MERRFVPLATILGYCAMAMGDLTSQQKEWFSRAFLVAVAASAGYPVEITLNDVNGVDAAVKDGGITVDWQLKGTSSPNYLEDGKHLAFGLDVRTYDLLTGTRNTPAYLGVVVVPKDIGDWAVHDTDRLMLKHCGYWVRVTGMEATQNSATVQIHLPLENRLTVGDVKAIMATERRLLS